MKKNIISALALGAILSLLPGCAWEVGGGSQHVTRPPTVGQQLVDLQKAKEAGAITEAEYQVQKAKFLGSK